MAKTEQDMYNRTMTYRISKKTQARSILAAILIFLSASALFAICLIPVLNKKTSPDVFVISFFAFMVLSASAYLIYCFFKQLRSFITLDKENGITYCNGFKTVNFKLKLVEQLNSETTTFTFLTLKRERFHHVIVDFSMFENKTEIYSFLADNVTDRFGRLKFKTEQMIQQELNQELDAENFNDNSTGQTKSDIKNDERTVKNTNRILRKEFHPFNLRAALFIIFDVLSNVIIITAYSRKSIPLCILYLILLFVYPVYTHFSKIYSLDDLFFHFLSLFYFSGAITGITAVNLVDSKAFFIIAFILSLVIFLVLFLANMKVSPKTDAEKIIDSVQKDNLTPIFRKVLISVFLATVPLTLINDIFDRNADVVEQATLFMENGIYYAEVPIEKNGMTEKVTFTLRPDSKLDFDKPVYYRYKKGFFKISTVVFFNKK